MRRRGSNIILIHPDPWELDKSTDNPSPTLTGTLSPSDGERDGVRGLTSVPRATRIQACGSGVLILALFALAVAWNTASGASLQRLEEREFGKLPNGTAVKLFTLRNASGMSAKIMTYGAILTELRVPDRHGVATNVVLGADTLEQYLKGFRSPAAVIGRVANRIAGARFTLDGVEYKLAANDGPNHIHGVFDKRVWEAKALPPGEGRAAVQLSYLSKDGEEGYPGNLTVKLTYTLTDNNELRLDYEAATDRATPINLTSHAYFNLAGAGDVLDHELWLAAVSYTPADDALIPTGQIATVKGTPLDFTKPTRIGARIAQFYPKPGGYDHNFVLDGEAGQRAAGPPGNGKPLALAARVREPVSGRVMEVRTTEPGVQLYTGNHLKHAALCLETQHYPDSVNHPGFPSTILRPGQAFSSTTAFAFSVK
jgi:aldose 1-epimerase